MYFEIIKYLLSLECLITLYFKGVSEIVHSLINYFLQLSRI